VSGRAATWGGSARGVVKGGLGVIEFDILRAASKAESIRRRDFSAALRAPDRLSHGLPPGATARAVCDTSQ
jgi:hypothetical protein